MTGPSCPVISFVSFGAVPLAVTGVRSTGPSRWRLVRNRRRVTSCELWSARNRCNISLQGGHGRCGGQVVGPTDGSMVTWIPR